MQKLGDPWIAHRRESRWFRWFEDPCHAKCDWTSFGAGTFSPGELKEGRRTSFGFGFARRSGLVITTILSRHFFLLDVFLFSTRLTGMALPDVTCFFLALPFGVEIGTLGREVGGRVRTSVEPRRRT